MKSPTETGARDAFLHLIAVAHADRVTTADEAEALEDFRRYLDITPKKARGYRRLARRIEPRLPKTTAERENLWALVARMAYVDGCVCPGEQRFLDELGEAFEIPMLVRVRIRDEEERRSRINRRHTRRVIGVIALLVVAVAGILVHRWHADQALGDEMRGFKEIERRFAGSVLVIDVRYRLRSPDDPPRFVKGQSTGTGFFITDEGHVVTNKHVLEPWKFPGEAADYLAEGYRVVRDDVEVRAWPGGTRLQDARGEIDTAEAYSSSRGDLQVITQAPDVIQSVLSRTPSGERRSREYHARDNHDLALLRCRAERPVKPLHLAPSSEDVRSLDPIMVMGFPRGLKILEQGRVEATPVVGRVRKSQETIQITAPVQPGNSGAPLLDRRGRVIGVATRILGGPTLGACIRVEHVWDLIPDGLLESR